LFTTVCSESGTSLLPTLGVQNPRETFCVELLEPAPRPRRSTSGTLVVHAAARNGEVGHDARQALLGHREGIPGQHHKISPLARLDGPLLALQGGRVCGETKRNEIVASDGNCITGAALSIDGRVLWVASSSEIPDEASARALAAPRTAWLFGALPGPMGTMKRASGRGPSRRSTWRESSLTSTGPAGGIRTFCASTAFS